MNILNLFKVQQEDHLPNQKRIKETQTPAIHSKETPSFLIYQIFLVEGCTMEDNCSFFIFIRYVINVLYILELSPKYRFII